MPTKPPRLPRPAKFAAFAAAVAALARPAWALTDDTTPFYVGGSLGVTHVSNVFRESSASNNDNVVSIGLLGGVDQRLGRQHLRLDGSMQHNRYRSNHELNNLSYTARAALDWETIGDLSGTLSAKSDRSLADFNVGNGVTQIFKKNTERNDEYQAIARLGVGTRYTLEGGWLYRRREFSAEEYDRFTYHQNTASLGVYATPAGNVKLGLVVRHSKGQNPRYPNGFFTIDPTTQQPKALTSPNDYTRDDLDFTTRWSTGGRSTLSTRISRSKSKNSLEALSDLSGTTGAIAWNWQPTAKLQFNVQYSRDTGQESVVRLPDVNRIYTTWQLGGNYALTSKLSLSATAADKRTRRSSEASAVVANAFEASKTYNLGVRWALSRGISLGCQYDHAGRDSSVPQYVFSASSYGCSGQAILY
jgi:hypothetical protein